MDAETNMEIRPALTSYLHELDGCFANVRSRRHLLTYGAGQLSDLQRKSIEPMADAGGVRPRAALTANERSNGYMPAAEGVAL